MKELGEYLRDTRATNGVSIEEAASDLELSMLELENIEFGNVRAFKDLYTLRSYIKKYAKYLGLDPEKVLDDFNDFLFEHTSKISLDDIIEAKTKQIEVTKKEQTKKIKSPYTKIKTKKVNVAPIALIITIAILVMLIIYLFVKKTNDDRIISDELLPYNMEERYELT